MTSVILGIIAAPISAVLLAASAESAAARTNTSANQLLQAQVEAMRTMPYTQVGVASGNPSGALQATQSAALSDGTAVTITTAVKFVNDPIPTAYVTNADYKKVTITISKTSGGKVLATNTTYVSAASAPPLAGTNWVQIKRTVVDAVTLLPIPGGTLTVTGGPSSVTRNDTTDGAGTALFPALDNSTGGTPVYAVTPTLSGVFSGYSVYPDDAAPQQPSQVSSAAGVNSIQTLRLYKGATLVVNLQTAAGAAYTGGATLSVESTRCGVATVTVPSGQSSASINTCSWANGKSTPLVPNVLGQTPSFDKYTVTMWSGTSYGFSAAVTVPSGYPGTLTQSVTVKFNGTTYSTKTLNVTVTKGGSADSAARVYVTCSAGPDNGLALYGLTNASGLATFTLPVTATASTCVVGANDQGATKGTSANQSWSTSTSSPIALTVPIS